VTHEKKAMLALYGLHAGLTVDESIKLVDLMHQEGTGKVYDTVKFARELYARAQEQAAAKA
jgi:hypothetical protein